MSGLRPFRMALVVLLLGALLLIVGLVWYANAAAGGSPPATTRPGATVPLPARAQALYGWLLVSSVLVLLCFVATVLTVRWGRQHRARLSRKRSTPTPSEDVWRMHRLPDE